MFTRYLPLACTVLVAFGACFAQEIPLSSIPAAMQKPIPEAVLYRMFLRHVATFEKQAQANPKTAKPLRNHILHKYGLNPGEYAEVSRIALDYDSSLQPLRERQLVVAKDFREAHFFSGRPSKSAFAPPLPAELKTIKAQMDSLTLTARDGIHVSLGDERFAHLHGTVIERAQRLYMTAPSGGAAQDKQPTGGAQ